MSLWGKDTNLGANCLCYYASRKIVRQRTNFGTGPRGYVRASRSERQCGLNNIDQISSFS